MKNKAFKIGLIWFVFACLTAEISYRLAIEQTDSTSAELLYDYSDMVSWPAPLVYNEVVKIKVLNSITENNLSEFTSVNMPEVTKENISALSEDKLFELENELSTRGVYTPVSITESYMIYILSPAFSGFMLYLIVSLFSSSRKYPLDKD